MIRSRPTRPLPSRKGWIVSNCACERPILTSNGRASSACRKLSKSLSASGGASGGGGTNMASFSVQPAGPIQFWLVRRSPGVRCEPRTPSSNLAWISRMSRTETGNEPRRALPLTCPDQAFISKAGFNRAWGVAPYARLPLIWPRMRRHMQGPLSLALAESLGSNSRAAGDRQPNPYSAAACVGVPSADGRRTRNRRIRRGSASSTRNSIPDGWLITSPLAGTRPARVNTSPPTVSISASRSSSVSTGPSRCLEILHRQPRVRCPARRRGARSPSGASASSCSSAMSPVIVSTRSSIVTSPSMPPYSSTTSARCMRAWRICSSRSSTGDLRRHHQRLAQDRLERERLRPADIGEHVLDVDHADDVVELLAIHRHARMALARGSARCACSRVTSARMAMMSARGTITSSAVVPRSRSTLAISARSWRSSSGGVAGRLPAPRPPPAPARR